MTSTNPTFLRKRYCVLLDTQLTVFRLLQIAALDNFPPVYPSPDGHFFAEVDLATRNRLIAHGYAESITPHGEPAIEVSNPAFGLCTVEEERLAYKKTHEPNCPIWFFLPDIEGPFETNTRDSDKLTLERITSTKQPGVELLDATVNGCRLHYIEDFSGLVPGSVDSVVRGYAFQLFKTEQWKSLYKYKTNAYSIVLCKMQVGRMPSHGLESVLSWSS